MIMSLSQKELKEYVHCQLNGFFPDKNDFFVKEGINLDIVFSNALERLENCLGSISIRGYHDESSNTVFSHLHADQYATFLYYLSNTLWTSSQNKVLCDKIMMLNRVLHSVFISYKCHLPEHFILTHPIGTVLGNAEYGDFLCVSQGVTVNTGYHGGKSPVLGKGLFLAAYSKIVGNMDIGDYVSLGVGTLVFQTEIPDNSVVKAKDGSLCVIEKRKNKHCRAQRDFNILF